MANKIVPRPRVDPWEDVPKADDPKAAKRFAPEAKQVREGAKNASKFVGQQWGKFMDWSDPKHAGKKAPAKTSKKGKKKPGWAEMLFGTPKPQNKAGKRVKKGSKKPPKGGGVFDIDPDKW